MNILLLHDDVGQGSSPDELDVFTQMQAIESALGDLGHQHSRLPFTINADAAAAALRSARPDLVFNLVESVGGSGRLIHVAPALLETLDIPYTGCTADAVYATSNKLVGKRLLSGAGINTPTLFTNEQLKSLDRIPRARYIVKSVWEHASRGLDEDSVVATDNPADLLRILNSRGKDFGGEGFAEAYIDGREFNLSILDGPGGPEVLAPAEIVFDGYAPDKPKVVGYRAKWDESSYEYHHTPRRFDFHDSDRALLQNLTAIALRCWQTFSLRGYARVDFRVDPDGKPWVLEINTNPCLSLDAGFAATLERSGIPYTQAIARIVAASALDASMPPASMPSSASKPISARTTDYTFRDDPRPSDSQAIRDIVASTGFFHDFEVDVAVELVDERLALGLASEYFFLFLDDPATQQPIGYACFGPIACTVGSYDLYWIAVHNSRRGQGLGQLLMTEMERRIAAGLPKPAKPDETVRGRRIYIETSAKPQYEPTRSFYLRCGYVEEARFRDFYAPGEDKLVYGKSL